ncbi:MAG: Pls/PosA family non-ribosomal peptide synthetase, partial [Ferruginibacter sp.]
LYTFYVLDDNAAGYDFTYLWESPLLSATYILLFILLIAGISRLLSINMKPGVYSVYSFTYYKKWIKDQMMNLALIVIHPIYATIYAPLYYRLLGAKVGKSAEISTASDVTHHLLEIGDNSFIADAVILGEHEVRNQELVLEKTTIGNNSFVGNGGLIPQGYTLADDMLIGVLSKPPTVEQMTTSPEKDWFGSPPIGLPQRERNISFNRSLTFQPPLSKKIARGLVEAIRIILPQTLVMIGSVLLIAYVDDVLETSFFNLVLLLPFYYMAFVALPGFIITIILKWLLAGKYKPTALPMYSLKVWLSEAVTTFYEALSVPFLLDQLRGTMWLPLAFRLLGVKTGKRVWLNTTDITEFDMVSIGDEAMLNEDCGPQTHLFEDRIMKIGTVKIGKQTTIGSRSIILYNTIIGDNVSVGSLSLVMKGEELPDNTEWIGSPVKPAG